MVDRPSHAANIDDQSTTTMFGTLSHEHVLCHELCESQGSDDLGPAYDKCGQSC